MPLFLALIMIFVMSTPITSFAAQPTVNLGTTSSYAVLAGSGIVNTGATTINGDAGGDVGSYPTGTFVGQADVTLSGTVHLADAAANSAQNDLNSAYLDAAGRAPVTRIASELGGTTLTPGVYDSADGTFQITGTLTLDALGDPNGVFIFKTASTLITASNSNVSLMNSARYCRTFWQVGSSATLGTYSHFVGHIFAMASITATTGATVQGQLLARSGAVTLDSNTITNGLCADVAPTLATLHVIKHVINDHGRTATAADFSLHVKTGGVDVATSPTAGAESPGTTYTLAAGTYAVTENPVAGYTSAYTGDGDGSGNITLAAGEDKTITITNDDLPPGMATLHVIKHVINDNGRTATAADFSLHVKTGGVDVATSPTAGAESPGTTYTLAAGTYAVTENPVAGYTAAYTGDSDGSGNITLVAGTDKTITITNDDQPLALATLHVIKHVVNNNGRTATAGDFTLHVKTGGVDVATSPKAGAESPGSTYTLAAGTYAVTENSVAGYTSTYTGDSDGSGNITLAAGADKTITITNDDQPLALATLHVIKHVVNNNGRTATAGDFNIHVKTGGVDVATSPKVGVESPGTTYTLAAGTYAVTENPVAGYTATYTGDSDGSGNITLAAGADKTVTITNDDQPLALATLHVIKHVVNTNGRTATAANFNLHVKMGGIDVATSPKSGAEAPGTTYNLSSGTYVVSEEAVVGYIVVMTGDGDAGGIITLAPGANKTITLTNTDIPIPPSTISSVPSVVSGTTGIGNSSKSSSQPPLINVTKIPRPLALTSGAGMVTYTYKVTNPGNVALTDIRISDDKVSTLNYVSGDTNKDKKLQFGETWIYTAQAKLTATTTNAVTVKGTGNGMTAMDVANATVVVTNNPAEVIYPPLINVTKIPNPLALLSGPGVVVYTYKVTNPGVVPLKHVAVTDNKISRLDYVAGDLNRDQMLQPNETWTYTGKIKLVQTDTNTVTAKGEANGMTAIDIAVATVVVTQLKITHSNVTQASATQPRAAQLNNSHLSRGSVLPMTASPWYNLLLAGAVLMLVGAFTWKQSRKL